MTVERRFPKSIDSLEQVFAFLQEALAPVTAHAHLVQALTLGTEEFFTNCVKYNLRSKNDVLVSVRHDPTSISVQIIDDDVDLFDVTGVPQPDLAANLESRRPGGLGIHISRLLLDHLSYEYSGNSSIITMTMNLQD